MRRIGLIIPNFSLGGAERQAVRLAMALPEYGWEPVLFVAEPHGEQREAVLDAGIPVIDLKTEFHRAKFSPGFWTHLKSVIALIRKEARERNLVLLQSFLFWQNQLAIPAAMKHPTIKGVITGRRNTGEFKDKRPLYQKIENLTNRFSNAIVCNSETVKRDTLSRESVSEDRLYVIHNGIDTTAFSKLPRQDLIPKVHEFTGGEFIIGTIGNMKRQKRHDRFLQAMKLIQEKYPTARGLIIGRDLGEEADLLALRRELGLRNTLAMIGGTEDVASYLRGIDVFVLSSDHEGMPNVVLEAMASEVPVVSTPTGGVEELISHRREGIITQDYTAESIAKEVIHLLDQPEGRLAMGEAGFRRVEKYFTVSKMVEAYVDLYDSILR